MKFLEDMEKNLQANFYLDLITGEHQSIDLKNLYRGDYLDLIVGKGKLVYFNEDTRIVELICPDKSKLVDLFFTLNICGLNTKLTSRKSYTYSGIHDFPTNKSRSLQNLVIKEIMENPIYLELDRKEYTS